MFRTQTPTVLAASLNVGSILMALIIGHLFFHERLNTIQYVGVVVATTAVVLLGWKPSV